MLIAHTLSSFPSSNRLARPVFTHPHHCQDLVWSTAASAVGPVQPPAHGCFIWWLEEKPIPQRGVFTWYISGEEPGDVCEGEVRKWLLINHLPREAWQERRSRGNQGKKQAVRQLSTLAAECRPRLERRVSCVYTLRRCRGRYASVPSRGDGRWKWTGEQWKRKSTCYVLLCLSVGRYLWLSSCVSIFKLHFSLQYSRTVKLRYSWVIKALCPSMYTANPLKLSTTTSILAQFPGLSCKLA